MQESSGIDRHLAFIITKEERRKDHYFDWWVWRLATKQRISMEMLRIIAFAPRF
jgi:hypothetical protein